MPLAVKFCGQCGTRNEPDDAFCESCGNPLDAPAGQPAAESPEPGKGWRQARFLVPAVALVLLFLAAPLVLGELGFSSGAPGMLKSLGEFFTGGPSTQQAAAPAAVTPAEGAPPAADGSVATPATSGGPDGSAAAVPPAAQMVPPGATQQTASRPGETIETAPPTAQVARVPPPPATSAASAEAARAAQIERERQEAERRRLEQEMDRAHQETARTARDQERAAREAADRGARETAERDRLSREANERSVREAADRSAREAAERTAREEAERAAKEAADRAAREAEAAAARIDIPAGTEMNVRLMKALNSGTVKVEDRFEATTTEDLNIGGRVMVPAGSVMRGIVSSVQPATRTNRTAKMTLAFDLLTIKGAPYPIRGTLTQTFEGAGIKGETTKIATGAGIGAIIGGILGGAKGAAIGAGVGGGGTVAATEGKEIELAQGTLMRVRMEARVQ